MYGRTFALFRAERCCGDKFVTITRTMQDVVAAVFAAAEQCEVFHDKPCVSVSSSMWSA